ncbi:MAG TPA: hypothetical protein VKA47_03335 [Solirubrobacterales bacterium]|nr:hypothetical protein [Solirubrobacterales bacterium]
MADPQEHSRIPKGETPGAPPSRSEANHPIECVEWCPICRAADVVRATAPPELRDQWQSVQREALLTTRALIDTYLERLDTEPDRGPRVQDIPIE